MLEKLHLHWPSFCTVSRISKITNILGQNINFYRQKLWVKVDLYIPPFALLYKTQLFGGILTIWAIGKTSIEKCDLGAKLSFLGLHYIVLQCFTVYPDCIIRIPWQTACGKPFYTSTSRLGHLWLPCAFFSSASTVWWVWCDTCQRNCKSQLHHPFSSSETSFEFSLLEETRVSSHSDMLHAFHSLASVCAANHRPGPTPLPWLSSSRIKIVKPDLQVQLCLRWTGID